MGVAEVASPSSGWLPVLGFALKQEARQWMEPNRVHHGGVYGLAVRLGLLSTPSLDDAVTSGYGQPVLCPKGTFTLLLVCAFRRTVSGLWPSAAVFLSCCKPAGWLAGPVTSSGRRSFGEYRGRWGGPALRGRFRSTFSRARFWWGGRSRKKLRRGRERGGSQGGRRPTHR
jgi:hypothetical protein